MPPERRPGAEYLAWAAVRGLAMLLTEGPLRRLTSAERDAIGQRLLDMVESDLLVCGHTHIPYHRILPSGRHVINEGSVGKPKDGDPRACYVILEARGRQLSVEFVRVPYDIERAAQAIEASDMPHEYAGMLRAGKG